MSKARVAIIGCGDRTISKFVPAINDLSNEGVVICAVVDPDNGVSKRLPQAITLVPNVGQLIEKHSPELAYVATPHDEHKIMVDDLISVNIPVLKEKPFALNLPDAQDLANAAKLHRCRVETLCHRRFSRLYQLLQEFLPEIGNVSAVNVKETISVADLSQGWRACKQRSGGGVVLDLGYHMLDQLVMLFGDSFEVLAVKVLKTRSGDYDVEDTAHITILFQDSIHVTVFLSRSAPSQCEEISIIGDKGSMHLSEKTVQFVTWDESAKKKSFERTILEDSSQLISKAVLTFLQGARDNKGDRISNKLDLDVMRLINEIYCRANPAPAEPTTVCWSWPRVTDDVQDAVNKQLQDTISVPGNGNVLGEFEKAFARYHSVTDHYALLHNSGTNALHALYYAAGVLPGDEVIVPVYTFHATVSPLMQLGAVPIFVDASPDTGNINSERIQHYISSKTKAVVVTHMWGYPCAMSDIVRICQNAQLILLEDCSHAHGALIDGQKVGTFGDGAAWSIQGEKIVSGGEGGVTLTRHANFYYRQLLHGHYNKRCRAEIPKDDALHDFALTGIGLKNRAHPLAVAVALTQLKRLDSFLANKRRFANVIKASLSSIPYLKPLEFHEEAEPAWYAFIFQFDQSLAPTWLTRERFVQEVIARGFEDVDIPGSTKPLFNEPLYNRPWEVLPHLYRESAYKAPSSENFPGALQFHKSIIKMPVWGFEGDQRQMEMCVSKLIEAAESFRS